MFLFYLDSLLKKTFDVALSSGKFPDFFLSANVLTLPKQWKELLYPQNFHPISLLNTDLKLYAKIMAQRLTPILPPLIHDD